MEAQVWTLIAMMFTALVGLFFYVSTRFDSLTGRLDEHSLLLHELKAQSTLHGEGLNRLDARVERLDTRVERLDTRVERLDTRVERLEGRVEHLDGRVDQIDGRMDNLEGAVHALGQSLGEQIYSLAKKLDEHLRRHAS